MRLYPNGLHLTHRTESCGEKDKLNLVGLGEVYDGQGGSTHVILEVCTVVATPYGIWTNKDPYFYHLKVWGCPA